MRFLNGFKTIVGAIGTAVLAILPSVSAATVAAAGDHLYGIVQGAFGLLTVLGVVHKVEKGSSK